MSLGLSRTLRLLAAVAMILVMLLTTGVTKSYANLSGSSFEGNDGNMVVNTTGNHDWVNAPNLTKATDTPSGANDSSFANGAKEDFLSPGVGAGSIPPNKNDLIHFYTANELANGSNFLYVAFTRATTSGNADIDFEINHLFTPSNASTGDPIVPLNRTAGDALFQFTYPGGGGAPGLEIWRWAVDRTSVAAGGFYTGSCLVNSTTQGPPCWSDPTQATAAQFEGFSNTGTITNPLDGGNSLAPGTFGEAAINLQASGIFPAGSCAHFGDAWAKSRSADSGSSDLKDLIAPQAVNISNCGSITIHKVTQNGDGTFGFTTTGGLTPSTFNLSNGGTQTYSSVPTGSYSVTEGTLPTGWTLANLACTPTGSGTSTTISGATASITIGPSGNADCTYTNFTKLSPSISTTLSATTVAIGALVHDSSTLTGATSDAGGSVTYTAYSDNKCSAGATDAGTKTLNSTGVPDSNAITFSNAGTYYWQAVYSGDANNNGATSACTSEIVTVSPNNPSIVTQLKDSTNTTITAPVAIGAPVHDTAALNNATSGASGTVKYYWTTDNTCQTNLTQVGATKTVTGGVVPNSDVTSFSSAGTYYWEAVYSGDSNNNGATSMCGSEIVVVGKNSPSIATQLKDASNTNITAPVAIGTVVHDTATLTGATSGAGGTVTYTVYTDNQCSLGATDAGTKTVTNGGVPDSTAITFSNAGTYYWQAVYSGDANNNVATSACTSEVVIVSKNSPGMTSAQNLIPNDAATLKGATSNAGGTVTLELFNPANTTCSGTPDLTQTVTVTGNGTYKTTNTTFVATTPGTWRWLVVYSGDGNNDGQTVSCGTENFSITNG